MNQFKEKLHAVCKWDMFNYYGDFLLLPLVLCIDFYYLFEYQSISKSVYVSFFIGFIVYGSILEYAMHRYVYHGRIKSIKKLHLIHHQYPRSYVASPPYITACIIVILHVIFMGLLGYKTGCAFVAGIVLGYLWYITIHHLIHHIDSEHWNLLNHFKMEHQFHHEHAKVNYCVSQPFWNRFYRKFQ